MAIQPEIPTTDQFDDLVEERFDLDTPTGVVPVLCFRPASDLRADGAARPAIVIGAEAFGINVFTRNVAATLAHGGYVVSVPDYWRGGGPVDRDGYEQFEEVLGHIDGLDFVRATHDLLAAVEQLRSRPFVDPDRVASWGYCTGATLALLTACLDRRLAASVLFFPSQPMFPEITPQRPVHPMDLLWNVACPLDIVYGDQDPVMQPDRMTDLRRRLEQWGIEHELRVYPGVGHAFSAPRGPLRHDAADRDSWPRVAAALDARLRP